MKIKPSPSARPLSSLLMVNPSTPQNIYTPTFPSINNKKQKHEPELENMEVDSAATDRLSGRHGFAVRVLVVIIDHFDVCFMFSFYSYTVFIVYCMNMGWSIEYEEYYYYFFCGNRSKMGKKDPFVAAIMARANNFRADELI